MPDLVSIVMAAYNAGSVICSTIESVIDQTYTDWELIVVNDASTDYTRKIMEEYVERDKRISLYNLDQNHGYPAYPRNFGVRKARGTLVAILDSDDIWHPEKLAFQVKYLQETKAHFCSTQMINFKNESEIQFREPAGIRYKKITFSNQLRRYSTPTSSVLLKRNLLEKFPFIEDKLHGGREDLKCWLQIHQQIGESIKLNFPFVYYRITPGQLSGSKPKMLLKSFIILWNFRLSNGNKLGVRSIYFMFTHVFHAIHYRILKKSL